MAIASINAIFSERNLHSALKKQSPIMFKCLLSRNNCARIFLFSPLSSSPTHSPSPKAFSVAKSGKIQSLTLYGFCFFLISSQISEICVCKFEWSCFLCFLGKRRGDWMRYVSKDTSNSAEQWYSPGYYKVTLIGFLNLMNFFSFSNSFSFCVPLDGCLFR